jgi:hypothetical protein
MFASAFDAELDLGAVREGYLKAVYDAASVSTVFRFQTVFHLF